MIRVMFLFDFSYIINKLLASRNCIYTVYINGYVFITLNKSNFKYYIMKEILLTFIKSYDVLIKILKGMFL